MIDLGAATVSRCPPVASGSKLTWTGPRSNFDRPMSALSLDPPFEAPFPTWVVGVVSQSRHNCCMVVTIMR